MAVVWATLVALALAQQPAPAPPVVAAAPVEITVYGELEIRRARTAVTRQMEELGYRMRERDGALIYLPPRRWLGRATFDREGVLAFKRPVVAFPRDQETGPRFVILPSDRILEAERERVREAVQDEVGAYVEVLRATAHRAHMDTLPDRLEELWTAGTPLQPGPELATPSDRRAAVLAYWATRADTPEGADTSAAVEAWLRAEVQTSEHPVSDSERADAEARRSDGRPLSL